MKEVITALVTPFNKEGHIDKESFIKLLEGQERAKISGVVIGGTTGEGWSLSDEEFFLLYTLARTSFSGEIIIGTGASSTREAIRKTEKAKEMGADKVLVVVPPYNMPTEEGVVAYFSDVAEVGIPVVAYHHPKRTGLFLSLDCLKKVAALPGVVGIKDASGDPLYTRELSRCTALFVGNDAEIIEAKQLGAKGVISVISNLLPNETKVCIENESKELPLSFNNLLNSLFGQVNPLGIKALLAEKNEIQNFVRKPLVPMSIGEQRKLGEIFRKEFLKEFANN